MIDKFSKNYSLSRFLNIKYFILILLLIFFLGFLLGAVGIRYGYIKNSYYFLKNIPKIIDNYSNIITRKITDYETVNIDMKFEEFQIITSNRDRNILEGHAVYTKNDWAKGKINFSSEKKYMNAKFRLKGTMSDNWIKPDGKWSYRVKLRKENRYDGMKEFSLFRPNVGSGVLEWLFQKIAKEEGLLTLNTKFVKLNLNGKHLGYYYLQEHYSKALIENNDRREGPLVGYGKERLVKLWYSDPSQILNSNGFNIADLKLTGDYKKLNPEQKKLSSYALGLLEKLRNRDVQPSKILDVDSTAKLLALRAVIASSDLDWKDIKFYYNPLSSKLEPIVREAHAEYDLFDWWYRGTRQLKTINVDHTTFEDIIFSDKLIYEKYIEYLRKYFSTDIIQKTINNNRDDFDQIVASLALSNDVDEWFDNLRVRKEKIKSAFSHPDPISVSLIDNKFLKIRNYQFFPIIIKKIIFNNKAYIYENNNLVIQGKINDEKYHDTLIDPEFSSFNFKPKTIYSSIDENEIQIHYSLYGDNNLKIKNVENFDIKISQNINNQKYKEIFFERDNFLHNKNKTIIIDTTIVTPKHLKVKISPGSTLIFKSNGQLISFGGIDFNGTKNSRISVFSSADSNNGGILVSESSNKSSIFYTDFKNLKGVSLEDKLITGCINFYKSDVVIQNSSFLNNFIKDDYINIINSKFEFDNISIYDSFADSIDIDFSFGTMKNVKIFNAGNDGLDFSDSKVELKDILVHNSFDKALSVGENSNITANLVTIEESFIGIAVKDGATFNSELINLSNNEYDFASFIKKVGYGSPELNITKGPNKFTYILDDKSKISINGKNLTKSSADLTDNIKEILYN